MSKNAGFQALSQDVGESGGPSLYIVTGPFFKKYFVFMTTGIRWWWMVGVKCVPESYPAVTASAALFLPMMISVSAATKQVPAISWETAIPVPGIRRESVRRPSIMHLPRP